MSKGITEIRLDERESVIFMRFLEHAPEAGKRSLKNLMKRMGLSAGNPKIVEMQEELNLLQQIRDELKEREDA